MRAPTDLYRGGSGPPLVLLHGLSGSWRIWRPVIPALEEQHSVLALTLAGHRGALPLPAGCPVTVEEVTNALERRLDELGIGEAHVAGNSLGGWVALELARRGRAISVAALSPAGAWSSPRDARRLATLLRLGRQATANTSPSAALFLSRPRARRMALRLICERGDRIPAAEVPGLLEDAAECNVLDGLTRSVLESGPMPALDGAARLVTLAWGTHDRLLPWGRYGQPMLDRLPGARLIRLPGVGHTPMADDPGLVARAILESGGRFIRTPA